MDYELVELESIPDLKECIAVRGGTTKKKALENLNWLIGAEMIKCAKDQELVCYLYKLNHGDYEATLISLPKEKSFYFVER